MNNPDIFVSFPSNGVIRLWSRSLFANSESPECRRFIKRVFEANPISSITIAGGSEPRADLRFCPTTFSRHDVAQQIVDLLALEPAANEGDGSAAGNDGPGACSNGHPSEPARVNKRFFAGLRSRSGPGRPHGPVTQATAPTTADDDDGIFRYHRRDTFASSWETKSDLPGRVRLKNPLLFRKKVLCQAIERALTGVLGIDRFSTNSISSTVLVHYDPRQLTKAQLIEILDAALAGATRPDTLDQPDLQLPLCTASLPLAATAQFVSAALMPPAALLYAYTSIPTFKEARRIYRDEKRIGVDALDAVVMVGCLGTMSIFPGAVCCWCLSFGRYLVKRSRDSSQKLLLNAFGKQPRYVWLCRDDGSEIQVLADKLEKGDLIVVHTGEVVPVDGHVMNGMAMIDQHALTGESTPAEKGVGDHVFASTLVVAGEIQVVVEKSGSDTASAKINQILTDTAGYKMSSQHKGERLADKFVWPTLGVGALGMATMGPMGAVAVLNSDLGTGIRMAAPLAMLSSLTLCASKGILVKDGRALEMMNQIDTVLFDKTGTLTRERPEVSRVITAFGWDPDRILSFAAAAERKFHHPIALAILHKAEELRLDLPPTDDTKYKVGYGITVYIDGYTIRVGSKRFIETEGIPMPPEIVEALAQAHLDGHTMVMVAVNDHLGGAIELQSTVRPEVREVIKGLRDRGVKHIAIISGDHDAPTRRLAESLGMDSYFAQVLPADKADYVAKLQAQGGKVCFVGDGINDSIALKKADISISLRGASSIATDTAQIVFLEGGLSKLCDLKDISRDLDRNVNRSWSMIIAPNVTNVIGVFTMGFGVMTSVITNNVSALAALANGLMPLRLIGAAEAERKREREANAVPAEPSQSAGLARNDIVRLPRPADIKPGKPEIDRHNIMPESA